MTRAGGMLRLSAAVWRHRCSARSKIWDCSRHRMNSLRSIVTNASRRRIFWIDPTQRSSDTHGRARGRTAEAPHAPLMTVVDGATAPTAGNGGAVARQLGALASSLLRRVAGAGSVYATPELRLYCLGSSAAALATALCATNPQLPAGTTRARLARCLTFSLAVGGLVGAAAAAQQQLDKEVLEQEQGKGESPLAQSGSPSRLPEPSLTHSTPPRTALPGVEGGSTRGRRVVSRASVTVSSAAAAATAQLRHPQAEGEAVRPSTAAVQGSPRRQRSPFGNGGGDGSAQAVAAGGVDVGAPPAPGLGSQRALMRSSAGVGGEPTHARRPRKPPR
eukprot:COSAG01_NODE_2003_length_8671_cov_9.134858_1_plen_332_part_10